MPYVSELGTGQRIYLDNQGNQTVFTLVSSSLGQQQQSSNSFTTGTWTAPPQIFQTSTSIMAKIYTAQGEQIIQIQGNNFSMVNLEPSNAKLLQIQETNNVPNTTMSPLEPMKPLEPLKMEPMTMKMGNMTMSMGNSESVNKRFCSQCGASLDPSDRFCSSCGHKIS